MSPLLVLLKKDLLIEIRTKETLALLVAISLLLSTIIAFGVRGAFLTNDTELKITPFLIWTIFIFTATVSISRSIEHEFSLEAIQDIKLSGTPLWLAYLSKTISNTCLLIVSFWISTVALFILINLPFESLSPAFIGISTLVIIAYTSLATFTSYLARYSSVGNILLPSILLPFTFPIIFAALELSTTLLVDNNFEPGSPWFSLLIVLDVVYLLVGINLFDYIVKD